MTLAIDWVMPALVVDAVLSLVGVFVVWMFVR